MSVNGTTRWFALGLSAALLLPALGFAQQPDAVAAQKDKEIAALKARIDELLRLFPAESPENADQMKALKLKLAQLMKERAGAEFAGYAEEEARQRVKADLKRIAEAQVQFTPDADKAKAQAELQRAEAILAQKAQEAKELDKKIRELQERIKLAAPPAKAVPAEGVFLFELVPQQASEEIVLRKVNGKWEVINPRATKTDQPLRVILGNIETAPGADRPRAVVPPPTGQRPGAPIEIRPVTPPPAASRSPDARIDELEKKMDKVMQQLEQLGRELHRNRSAAPGDEAGPRLRIVGDRVEFEGEGELKLVPNPELKR